MSRHRTDFFTNVFTSRLWSSIESASGHGSDTVRTRSLVKALPIFLQRLEVHSFLDIPCGDFHWMRDVDFGNIAYIGGDIVPEIVQQNTARYTRPGICFKVIDLVTDKLPSADMIFVRDCFIHFTNDLILETLKNIARSKIKYLCTTHLNTFTPWGGPQGRNIELDRAIEGVNYEFRPLNWQLPPFNFPAPLHILPDNDPGMNQDNTMAVWRMEDIRNSLAK